MPRDAGSGMISVLLPTRNRPMSLARSVTSLLDNATGEIEILIRVDDDETLPYGFADSGCRVITGPRYGYRYLHRYYNELAGMAQGEWLMLWNDDAVMLEHGWDAIIETVAPGLKVLAMDQWCIFPVVHRSLYELLGHLSLNAHCDSWLEAVCSKCGILPSVPIKWDHTKPRDRTTQEREEMNQITSPEFFSPGCQALLQQDVEKVKQALHGQSLPAR